MLENVLKRLNIARFYVGEHRGPEPDRHLCVAQASLLGAVPIM